MADHSSKPKTPAVADSKPVAEDVSTVVDTDPVLEAHKKTLALKSSFSIQGRSSRGPRRRKFKPFRYRRRKTYRPRFYRRRY